MQVDQQVPSRPGLQEIDAARTTMNQMRSQVERMIVGKRDVIDRLLVAVLAEGHVLIEDVPGTGKTTLARALALALGGSFHRIQFTPDLLPSDVTGSLVFNQQAASFDFHPGPIFANIILADEINRAGPRTQAALLEGMEERQVTAERATYPLPRPFLVIATQNPVELDGTFPLPEAQLDRFFLSTSIGYPDRADEQAMLRRYQVEDPLMDINAVTAPHEIERMVALTRTVHVGEAAEGYLLDIVRTTRDQADIELGASPRAALALMRAAQAQALIEGRAFVIPDDVRALAIPVLSHRIMPAARAELRGRSRQAILDEVVAAIPVPVEDDVALAAGR